jgi:hypothetical protein
VLLETLRQRSAGSLSCVITGKQFWRSTALRSSHFEGSWSRVDTLIFGWYVPRNPLQVQDKNRVKGRDQEQSNKGSDGESADLGIVEGFPERTAF